jgi:hypothetical protein
MERRANLKSLSDDELLRRLSALTRDSRRVEADLIAHIAEVDERRLYAREAAPSMFAYCTEVLHLSEPEAYLRIAVARASRQHPMLLTMLAEGRLHLSGIERLAPHLTPKNREALLKRAAHKSKRQIEELVAELVPRPDAPTTMRKLPALTRPGAIAGGPVTAPAPAPGGPAPSGGSPAGPNTRAEGAAEGGHRQLLGAAEPAAELGPDRVESPGLNPPRDTRDMQLRPDGVGTPLPPPSARAATVAPLSPARFRVQFTASGELRDKLERLQALMRSSVPDGDLAKIIDLAVSEKLERLEAKRFARTKNPRKGLSGTDTTPKSRYIPAPVRRAVHVRDGGRCTYRDALGRRCTRRGSVEFHHRAPFGRGGPHSPGVVALMCKAHNLLLAEQDYGKEKMARYRRSADRVSERAAFYGARRPRSAPAAPGAPATPGRGVCSLRVRAPAPASPSEGTR